jgi:hypothetical protein
MLMNRQLVDLFRTANEDHLRTTLERLLPEEDTEELIAAFRHIREIDAAPNVELVLRLDRDEDDVLVGGTDPKTGVDYAMDLLPWAAYLGLKVPDALLEEFECEEMVAHVLGEMTFYGMTEESKAETLREVLRLKPDAGGDRAGEPN